MKPIHYTFCLMLFVVAARLGAASCSINVIEATRIVFKGEQLAVERSGFFPYVMSGTGAPDKYKNETWAGTGASVYPGCGCYLFYSNIVWSGTWSFSASDYTNSSSKTLSYDVSGCVPSAHEEDTGLKQGIVGSGLGSPGVTGQPTATSRSYVNPNPASYSSCTFGHFWEYTNVTETLSGLFTPAEALARAESTKTTIENSDGLQYWNSDYPATADAANALLTAGTISRTTPVTCHAKRIVFKAQFPKICSDEKYLITYYYKRWLIGANEPSNYETFTEEVELKDDPYFVPESGYRAYHIDLTQGEQCKLVKVTARSLARCENQEPGNLKTSNNSVDVDFYLGLLSDGSSAGSLGLLSSDVNGALFTPAALKLLAPTNSELVVVNSAGIMRQILAPQAIVDIVTTGANAYELRYYHVDQLGAEDPVTGIYTLSGDPYVTHLIENPDVGTASNRLSITETRGASSKMTLFSYDGVSNGMEMSVGGGLRRDILSKTTAGSVVTETRTIKNLSGDTTYVERQTKQQYPFGLVTTQHVRDPSGSALTTSYTYYANALTDGGAFRLLKSVVEPYGRWTRYAYDSLGRTTLMVTQFGDTVSSSADNLNRVTATTYDTIPDQDGDSIPEEVVLIVNSLLGQEIGRTHEIKFTALETAYGSSVEERWTAISTEAGATWDAATNLVTKRKTFVTGPWRGRLVSELRPDGTATLSSYEIDGGTYIVTTDDGALDGAGTAIIDGTRTVTEEDLMGRMTGRDVKDIVSNLVISSEVVTTSDTFGRPTRIDYLDGTFELRSYACCGLSSVTDRHGVTTSYQYDALGRLVATSRAGVTDMLVLDPDGNVLVKTRIGSDSSEIDVETNEYDVAGRLTSSMDALARETTYSEALNGSGQRVKTTTNPDGGTIVTIFFKDGAMLSTSGTAALSKLSYQYGVDSNGEYTTEIKVGGSGETTEWVKTYSDMAGRAYKRVYADSAIEMTYFNALGQVSRSVDADGVTRLFSYNAKGELRDEAIDINTNGVIDYSGLDYVIRTVKQVATRASYVVAKTVTETWETDAVDTATVVRVHEVTFNGDHEWMTDRGLVTSRVVLAAGGGERTVTLTRPDQVEEIQVYQNERVMSVTKKDSSGASLSSLQFQYDPHGRIASQTDARNGETTYTYFDDDAIHAVTTPDPDEAASGIGYDAQVTTYAYDSAGRVASITQHDGGVIATTYWPNGKLKRASGSRIYPSEYTYDSQGRMKTLTTWKNFTGNAGQAVTTWNYSAQRGWLMNKRHADNVGPDYTYTATGRLLTRTWGRGVSVTYGYNAAGNLDAVDYSDSTPDVALSYDRVGRLKGITDGAGTRILTYGVLGGIEDEDYTSGILNNLGVSRSYDAVGRLETLAAKLSSGPVNSIDYAYDEGSRLETVTRGANQAVYAYAADSNLIDSVTFKQGGSARMVTTKSFDNVNRLTAIDNAPQGGPAVLGHAYLYNDANQRIRDTRVDGLYWEYGYDALGQVTSAVKRMAGGAAVLGHQTGYSYDDIGNRVTATHNGNVSTYASNVLNQYSQRAIPGVVEVLGAADDAATILINEAPAQRQGELFYSTVGLSNGFTDWWARIDIAGTLAGAGPGGTDAISETTRHAWLPRNPEVFQYDVDGNLLYDAQWSYTWDGENRLISMQTRSDILAPNGRFPLTEKARMDFVYDYAGRRVKKVVSRWGDSNWVETQSIHYLYDGWNLMVELNAASGNTLLKGYAWGLDLSGTLTDAGGVGGLLFASTSTTTCAAGYDGNGNVVVYLDMSTGRMAATYGYDAFGRVLLSDGVGREVFPFGFSTKYLDLESKLVYYGYRYYNPDTGRWPSRDPIEEQGGENLYGFVANNPVLDIDVIGLKTARPATQPRQEPYRRWPKGPGVVRPLPRDPDIGLRPNPAYDNPNWPFIDPLDVRPVDTTAWVREYVKKQEETRRRRTELRVQIAQRGREDCCPVLELSRSRMPKITEFISSVYFLYPQPLHKGFGQELSNLNRSESLQGVPIKSLWSRDEYPFASTLEGGAGASWEYVPAHEQYIQGGVINAFYQKHKLNPGDCFYVKIVP